MQRNAPREPSGRQPPRPAPTGLTALSALPLFGSRGWLRRTTYAVASIPLALAYAALVAGFALAVLSAVLGVGVIGLIGLLALARGLGGFERTQAHLLLDIQIEPVPRQRHQPGRLMHRLRGLVTASTTWRTLAWLAVRGLLGVGVLAAMSAGIGAGALLALYPQWLGWPAREPWLDIAVVAVDVLLALLVLLTLDTQVRLAAVIAPRLLGPSPGDEVAGLRRRAQRLADRNRLARDLHDTIGHALTASLMQATAAQRTLRAEPVDPAFARHALEHIETSTRDALTELDRALTVLRDDTSQPPARSKTAVGPDLTGLDALLTELHDSGLPVTFSLSGSLDEVPLRHSQAGYRIVQEATTNVLRHAGCAPTTIAIGCSDCELTIRVCNEPAQRPAPRPGPGGGRGLVGLRERIAPLGGHLAAQATPDGGFELTAALPLPAAS